MNIVRYEPSSKAGLLARALHILSAGGTVVYPTETAYALGADFFSSGAYNRVYLIKSRSEQKPLPVIVPSLSYATTLARFNVEATRLAESYWPGPLTLVLPFIYSDHTPHHRDGHLAMRVSSHPLAHELAHIFGRPIVSTSANISGNEACYSIPDLMKQLRKSGLKPDLIIDAGALPAVLPSTMVKVDDQGLIVLRPGAIAIDTRS